MSGPAVLKALSAGRCPVCKYRGFVIGPQGGMSINIECGNIDCRARFNAVFYGGHCLMAQSIPKESEGGGPWPVPGAEGGHQGSSYS